MEKYEIKLTEIQESKLTQQSRDPHIQNYTTVQKDCPQALGGGVLTFIHKSVNFT